MISTRGQIAVRDSKDKSGPALLVSPAGWNDLLGFVCSGSADSGVA
jgi:hypothetical protein